MASEVIIARPAEVVPFSYDASDDMSSSDTVVTAAVTVYSTSQSTAITGVATVAASGLVIAGTFTVPATSGEDYSVIVAATGNASSRLRHKTFEIRARNSIGNL